MLTLVPASLPGKKYSPLPRTYVAVSVAVTRIMYCCRNRECKHVYAIDYRKCYFDGGYDLYRTNDGEQRWMINELCPLCGRIGDGKEVKGKSSNKRCDDQCKGAAGNVCECSCGGKNHGIHRCIS